ncbi:hypothetical protein [Streptomyces osmaniensis]|uniref:Uncharacterized protein n=1 Tax=Streptomyces osmaniensis TaxID=593134 RepID=A0ABP6YW69_9ACTN|nr:hypothetical protein KJK32_46550 [Streptomyces sp. JCM17656]
MSEDLEAVEYLYAIEADHYEGDDSRFYVPKRVITFRITKKTAKRIYYLRHERLGRHDIGYIDRQQIEAEGELFRKSAGWWEADARLYLKPPVLEVYAPAPDLAALKAAMRAAHPDMGGSHEAFLEAHERYERARVNASRV